MKAYYEKLFSYKQLMEHGTAEMKDKVRALVDEYHNYLMSGMDDHGVRWEFRIKEDDELRGNEFHTTILNKETKDKSVQLEVISDFDFNDRKYKFTLNNAAFRLVRLYEKEHKSLFADAKSDVFTLIKKPDAYMLQTISGNILWPQESKIIAEKTISFDELEKE